MSDLPPRQTSLTSGAISNQCVDRFPISIARLADIRGVEARESRPTGAASLRIPPPGFTNGDDGAIHSDDLDHRDRSQPWTWMIEVSVLISAFGVAPGIADA